VIAHRRASHPKRGILEGTGLTERAAGAPARPASPDEAHLRWEASMLAEIERIRGDVRAAAPDRLAACVGGTWHAGALRIDYWGRPAHIDWVGLMPRGEDGEPPLLHPGPQEPELGGLPAPLDPLERHEAPVHGFPPYPVTETGEAYHREDGRLRL